MKAHFSMRWLVAVMLVFTITNVGLAEKKVPTSYQQTFSHAQKQRKDKQYKESLATYQKALELAKTPTEISQAYIYIGHSYRSLRQWAKANEAFAKIVDNGKFIKAHRVQALYYLAYGQVTLKKLDQAKATVAKLLVMEKVAPTWRGYALQLDSQIACSSRDYKHAIESARKGLALEELKASQRAGLQMALAHSLRSNKQYDEAIETYQALLKMQKLPQSIRVQGLHHLGVSYMKNKQWDEAVDVFRKQIKDFPKQNPSMASWAKYRLALCLLQQKKTDEAKELFEQVVEMPKANKLVKKASYTQLDKLAK